MNRRIKVPALRNGVPAWMDAPEPQRADVPMAEWLNRPRRTGMFGRMFQKEKVDGLS